jgi:hypothetical protein
MRTRVEIYDSFHRDVSWITQDAIEEYAGAALHSREAADLCIMKWSRGDPVKVALMREHLVGNYYVTLLQEELIEEFGEERFIGKPLSKERRVRILEQRLLSERDNDVAAKISKEIRELNGEVVKPSDKAVSLTVNAAPSNVTFDRNNPREAERIVMSVLGALN